MRLLITVLFICLFYTSAKAQEKKLIGQKAEDIFVTDWLNTSGDLNQLPSHLPLDSLRDKVIVLDFWFIRCAPCVASIPHLNKLSELYPEIVFLSISFDKKDEMNDFLDRMMLNYPVGLDDNLASISNYEVELFPQTFVIDTNGIIQWQGSSFHLKENFLNKLLNVNRSAILKFENIEGEAEPGDILEFTYKKHDLEMAESSYFHDNPYDVMVLNQSLEEILQNTFDINNARILSADSSLLHTHYDISLKLNEETAEKNEAIEKLKYLLPDALGFDFIAVSVDTITYEVIIVDSTKLEASRSSQLGSSAHWNKKKWKGEGIRIADLVNFLENEYDLLSHSEVEDDSRYDFELPMQDFEKLQEVILEDYGIKLKQENKKTTLFQVVAKEQNLLLK